MCHCTPAHPPHECRFERRRKPRESVRIANTIITLREHRIAALAHALEAAREIDLDDERLELITEQLEAEREFLCQSQRMTRAYLLALQEELEPLR